MVKGKGEATLERSDRLRPARGRSGRQRVHSPSGMTAISPSSSRIPSIRLATPPTQNPISLRLYKVLGAHFDDDATREALDTLAELYAPSASSSGSTSGGLVNGHGSSKGKEVVLDAEADGDAEDEGEVGLGVGVKSNGMVAASALAVEESVAGETAARARKNLRRDVENKLAESSRQFLQAFGEVDKVCRDSMYTFTCTYSIHSN